MNRAPVRGLCERTTHVVFNCNFAGLGRRVFWISWRASPGVQIGNTCARCAHYWMIKLPPGVAPPEYRLDVAGFVINPPPVILNVFVTMVCDCAVVVPEV